MATLYITNTNATGPGTLVAALGAAQAGDTIAPDPTLFADGETVDIDLVSLLKIPVALTIDAGKTRLVLRRSRYNYLLDNREQTGFNDLAMRGVTLIGRVYVGGNASKRLTCAFEKCVFGGFSNAYNLFQTSGYVDATMTDCAFVGGTSRGIYLYGENNFATFTRCTIAANKKTVALATSSNSAFVDCVVDPPLESAGFCNVPSSLDEYSESNPIPWRAWNFAPRGDSPYASGGSTCAGKTDLLGVARGWTDESGATQYAVGAFEVVKANYYIRPNVGSTARFTDPTIWKTERGGIATPEVVETGVFYIDETVTFIDAPPEGASIVVAGPSRVEIGADCMFEEIRVGARSELEFKGTARGSALDLRDESLLELAPGTINTVDSLTNGSGVVFKSSSRSYFSAPNITPTLFETENVVVGVRGAGLTGFYAAAKNSNEVALSWTCKDSSVPIVVERRVDGGWTTALEAALGLTATVPFGSEPVELIFGDWRAWDGDVFLTASSFYAKVDFFKYWAGVDATVSVTEWIVEPLVVNEWITDTLTMKAGEMGYRNENALFLALIKNPLSGALLQPEEVSNITATFYKIGGWSSPNVWTPVEGWVDVAVPTDSVLPAPIDVSVLTQSGTTWSRDEGPNFSWTPNTTTTTPFGENGSYVVQVKIVLKDGKNPIVATFNNKVY